MLRILTFIIVVFPSISFSQIINGKVYDNESTLKSIKVINVTQNMVTNTDDKGHFAIHATIHDSLAISSLFHHTKKIKITQEHFIGVIVFELKKKINELDEVLLSNQLKNKPFKPIEYNENLGFSIAEDMKKNPHLYEPRPTNQGIDFIKLGRLIAKLFKSKKPKESPIINASYKHYDSLFSKGLFFNEKLLSNDLNIPKSYRNLFFDYCDAKNLNEKLLSKENRFILLDSLVKFSNEFLKVIDDYEKSK